MREMQKRKKDYEEFNQFFKMYTRDVRHSKRKNISILLPYCSG